MNTKNDTDLYDVQTKARGPIGELPLTAEMLLHRPSGDIFALSQNAGMGWNPRHLNRREFLILSTAGRHPQSRRHTRSRSATTPGIGKWDC